MTHVEQYTVSPSTHAHREYEVELHLRPVEPVDDERLEALAFQLLDALTANDSAVVLGPAVACNFLNREIELDMDVQAQGSSDLHTRIASVLRVIDETLPIRLDQISSRIAIVAGAGPAR